MSPGWITNRKLESQFDQLREFKRNISRLNRSPLSSGLKSNIYNPYLRASYQYTLGEDLNTSGFNAYITKDPHYPPINES